MKKKLIFIGNSIVNGFPYSRGKSFTGRIRAAAKDGTAGFCADVINKGVNGETTDQLLVRAEEDVFRHEPAALFIMSGTNDFIFETCSPREAADNMEALAAAAESRGILPVFLTPLLTDAPMASRKWMAGMGTDYEAVNDEIRELADLLRHSGRPFIDTLTAYREYHEEILDRGTGDGLSPADAETSPGEAVPDEAYHDGVHPTIEGHEYLARIIADWIRQNADLLGL